MSEVSTMHVPVLLQQVIAVLAIAPGDTVLDCTLGGGGHAEAILPLIGPTGHYVGIDADALALEKVRARLGNDSRVTCIEGNFRNLRTLLQSSGIHEFNRVLFDFGLSTDQYLGASGRGFSFSIDEPLAMTLACASEDTAVTAYHVVNEWSEESLADIIYGFGGETRARKIARAIVTSRKDSPIETSGALAQVVMQAYGGYRGKIHPATKTFQAIRMAVNDELGAIQAGLPQALGMVGEGGRIAVISFHSLEDRIVKYLFRSWSADGLGVIHTKRPVVADRTEAQENPKARSAKLRCFEKRTTMT